MSTTTTADMLTCALPRYEYPSTHAARRLSSFLHSISIAVIAMPGYLQYLETDVADPTICREGLQAA